MILLYIDPCAESLLTQVLIAGAVSVLNFFKNIKLVLSSFFNKIFKSNKKVDYHSPVNTFRFIIDQEFNQNHKCLEDKNYYTNFTFPLKVHKFDNEKSY